MKVVALEQCFFANSRRRVGQPFDVPDGTELPPHIVPFTEDEHEDEPSAREPETLSELTRKAFPAIDGVGGLLQ